MKSFQVAEFKAPLKEVDQPTPEPTGSQVLLKVKAAGVCHSDLHIWEGGYDLGHGRKPLSLKDRGVSLPRTMGHETVGEIVAFGPDAKAVTGGLKVGDVTLVYPWLGCGKCETCTSGEENMDQRRDDAERVDPEILRRMVFHFGHIDDMALVREALLFKAKADAARSARTPPVVKHHHGRLPKNRRVRSCCWECGATVWRWWARRGAATNPWRSSTGCQPIAFMVMTAAVRGAWVTPDR